MFNRKISDRYDGCRAAFYVGLYYEKCSEPGLDDFAGIYVFVFLPFRANQ